jgi:hypothetical protein
MVLDQNNLSFLLQGLAWTLSEIPLLPYSKYPSTKNRYIYAKINRLIIFNFINRRSFL